MILTINTNQKRTPWGAWLMLCLTIVALSASTILGILGCDNLLNHTERVSALIFAVLAVMILHNQPSHRIGWLCAAIGLFGATSTLLWFYSACNANTLPMQNVATWLNFVVSIVWLILMFTLLPMLFPDGRFLSVRWRWFTLAGCVILVVLSLPLLLSYGPMFWADGLVGGDGMDNPFARFPLPNSLVPAIQTVHLMIVSLLCLAGITSIAVRYRRSQGVMRQQLKWLVYFLVVAFGTQIVIFEIIGATLYPPIFETIAYRLIILVVFLGYPLVIGIAILRFRLYDIDVIIRRTMVYALVTGMLALVYVVSIIALQRLFVGLTGQESTLAIVVSTLLIAALFNPLRRRVQALIDRRFYRRKYDAESTLAQFGAVARDEVNLELITRELLRTVDRTVQPSEASLWMRDKRL